MKQNNLKNFSFKEKTTIEVKTVVPDAFEFLESLTSSVKFTPRTISTLTL